MNIVQLNQYIEKIARCIQIVHSYSSQSPYEYWNAKGDVQYGSVCFCIKKSRMRSNTITYDAVLYYGDRVVDTPSNKEQIWSDANNVIQNIVGTINMQSDGEVTVSYPYDITNFEQKFADNLAGAYATLSIDTKGIGECGDLLYGYEEEDKIKLESIVKTFTVNGEYDITSSKDYDAISDVKVIVNVAPDPKDTFATIGYNDETAGGFLNQFSADLEVSKRILDEWNSTGSSIINIDKWSDDTVYFPAVDLTMKPTNMNFWFYNWPRLQTIPALDFTGRTSMQQLFKYCSSLTYVGPITTSESMTNMEQVFYNCTKLKSLDLTNINTSNVTTLYGMFYNCRSLTELDLTHMNTSNVTTLYSMFGDCEALTVIKGLENFDVSNVTTIYSMFDGCKALTRLDLSKWNSKKLTDMYYCFWGMDNLTYLDISSWDLSNITSGGNFIGGYSNMNNLTDVKFGKNWKLNLTYNMFNHCPNLTVESLLSIINGLYDFTGNGETPTSSQGNCQFGTTNLNKLTDEQKAVAINKGWTLT